MPWARRSRPAVPAAREGDIVSEALPVALEERLFERHWTGLAAALAPAGGPEVFLERLGAKHRLFAAALGARPTMPQIEELLGHVFTARRRLYPALAALGPERSGELIAGLSGGADRLEQRIQRFVDAMPGAASPDPDGMRAAAKRRRAAWDFAAELVHFGDPARFPLMSRWVWDRATQSGALRQFARVQESAAELGLENRAEHFEGARAWLAQRLAAQGIYRDVPLWIDLVLAQAYLDYVRAVAAGRLGAEFGRSAPPHEQLAKLLGIDVAPGAGRARLRKGGCGEHPALGTVN